MKDLLRRSSAKELQGDAQFRAAFESSPLSMVVADLDGHITQTNRAYQAMLGYSAQDLHGTLLLQTTHPDDKPKEAELLNAVRSGKRREYVQQRRSVRKDGRTIWTQMTCFLLYSPGGEPHSYAGILEDLQQYKAVQASLQLTEEHLKLQNTVTKTLTEAESLDEAIDHLLKTLGGTAGWDVATFWEVQTDGRGIRCRQTWHTSTVEVPEFLEITGKLAFKQGEGLPGLAWQQCRPVWLPDVTEDGAIVRSMKAAKEGLVSALGFPVVYKGKARGVIELFSTERREQDTMLMLVTETIGTQLAVFYERETSAASLRASEDRNRMITEVARDGVITIDEKGAILAANPSAEQIFGYLRDEMEGQPLSTLMPGNLRDQHQAALDRYIKTGKRQIRWEGLELPGLRKNGERILLEISLAEFTVNGARTFTGFMRDITERKKEESALVYQALHDTLTGLPNRVMLQERLQQAVLVAQRHYSNVALLFMDLDRFKEVNDTFGHNHGDQLLQQVAMRLQDMTRDSDTFARLGGDEFALLMPNTDERGATLAAQRMLEGFNDPFVFQNRAFDVGASIGIAVFPSQASDAVSLMQHADAAMYSAKRAASGYAVYLADPDEKSTMRLLLTGELRQGIDNGELLFYHQPKVRLKDGRTDQAEGLVRWQHPQRGFIGPDAFIPLAEETGLIIPLTIWTLNEALRQHKDWREKGFDVRIGVNFSARILHDPQLVETVTRLLEDWDVEPSRLQVEITESAIMVDPERSLRTLRDLRNAGVWTALDDFGTGYSSMGYLKRLPVDELKIDRSFVMDMADNRDDASIVRSLITLGHNLGLQVVAEGIDNKRTLDMLVEMGCDLAQGFFLSRPIPPEDFLQWLSRPPLRVASPT